MTLADSAGWALAVTCACALAALLARALTPGGVLAGALVGACVSIGFGLPGLAVLGTFFVVGTLATRIGWKTKKARGTAEAGEGRRDWKRVLGKGGVAAALALLHALSTGPGTSCQPAFAGSIAAALADTLGTEIGTLSSGRAFTLPGFRRVPTGTAGAVTILGTFAAANGAALVGNLAPLVGIADSADFMPAPAFVIAAAGLGASLIESIAVGCGVRAPGFARNVLTTLVGALLAGAFVHRYFV